MTESELYDLGVVVYRDVDGRRLAYIPEPVYERLVETLQARNRELVEFAEANVDAGTVEELRRRWAQR